MYFIYLSTSLCVMFVPDFFCHSFEIFMSVIRVSLDFSRRQTRQTHGPCQTWPSLLSEGFSQGVGELSLALTSLYKGSGRAIHSLRLKRPNKVNGLYRIPAVQGYVRSFSLKGKMRSLCYFFFHMYIDF